MDSVILAGGILTPEDPLYPLLPIDLPKNKALVSIGGKPMIQWVLNALCDSNQVENIIIVGLDETSEITCKKPLSFVPDNGSMMSNIRRGVEEVTRVNPVSTHTLLAACDIPGLKTEMVDWAIENSLPMQADIVYHVVADSVMEARFPGSNRSYTHLKDGSVCGGDLNVIANSIIRTHVELWERLSAARKNVFKQAAIFGLPLLVMLLLRAIDLKGAADYLSKRLELNCQAVLCPYAEMAMDVDKPHQLALLRDFLDS